MAHGIKVPDPEKVADIVHLSVSDYHAFETITQFDVEDGQDGRDSGDGAGFSVCHDGIWYEVTIRPDAQCAECGGPPRMHDGKTEVFVPVNAPAIPATTDNPA